MPKRSIDATATAGELIAGLDRPVKTQVRTHSENQERAYIAASRRADRSIEARVQSARMASDIHKRRTGKGFKVSEDIVLKEEMYEEEEDDVPRQYRMFTSGLQGSELRQRAGMYVTTQVAMHVLAREQEVNKAFAEAYPNIGDMNQRMSESRYWQGMQSQQQQSGQQSPHQFPSPFQRSSVAASPQASAQQDARPARSPAVHHSSSESATSPPGLSSGSAHTESSASPSNFSEQVYHSPLMSSQIDPALMMSRLPPGGGSSIFTSELPQDVKDLAQFSGNFDFSDPSTAFLFGGDNSGNDPFSNIDFGVLGQSDLVDDSTAVSADDYFNNAVQAGPGQGSAAGTPATADGDGWKNFFDLDQMPELT